jgi:hypothetical protein
MTTDGGGWVLIGRGRDGWTFNPNGQGSAATVRTTPDGTGAFSPATLPTDVIQGLIANADLSANTDGIRLRRATSADGATRQEIRLFTQGRRWTWNLAAGQLLNRLTINGTSYTGSNTQDTAITVTGQKSNGLNGINDNRRIWTGAATNKSGKQGFGLGALALGGSSSATNFLWTAGLEGSPLGFTQVFLRPRIANDAAGYTPIPAAGYAAQLEPLALLNRSQLAPWGVTGLNHTNETMMDPWYTTVMAVQPMGDRVFVGGRFNGVQQGPSGATISQPFLAAFDLQGNWISTFKPQLDGRVWAMQVTNTGKLIVGGDFTTVNGASRTGLVALDPTTGATDASFTASVGRTGSRALVRSLEYRGDTLWAAGRFTTASGGTTASTKVTNAVSFNANTGQVGSWKPLIYASAVDLTLSPDGQRMYLAGYFADVNNDTNMGYYGITNPTTGAVLPGYGPYIQSTGASAIFQLGVNEVPNGNLVVGGSEHTLQMYNPTRTAQINTHITKAGGDFQFVEVHEGFVYAGCHCIDWDYQGTNNWVAPQGFRAIDPIRFIARYDENTLDMDTTWYPNGLKGTYDAGPWTIAFDKDDCLWMGGDFARGSYSGDTATDYLGGFARFCHGDNTAPTTPTALTATVGSDNVTLNWGASTDDSGSVSYDVYRNDRVIATVYGTTFTDTVDTGATGALRYTVRASDARGNRSASPAPIAVNGPAPIAAMPVAWGATWRYDDSGADRGTAWRDVATSDATWASGPAPLGWGGKQVTTVGATKPITTYYRTSFDVASAAAVKVASIDVKASQGAVVYLNGVEIGRRNMPTGPVAFDTVAATWIGGTDNDRVTTYTVPSSLLRNGTNVLAVEVHGWRAQSGLTVVDGRVTLFGANTGDTTAPSAPTVTAAASGSSVQVTWTPATDDQALGGYLVTRDGQPLTIVDPSTTSLLDAVSPATAHTYVVTAFDTAGNVTASPTFTLTPTPVETVLLGFNSTWRWLYPTDAPAAGWNGATFDDSTWTSGAGELGFGDTPKGTVISTVAGAKPLTSYYRSTVTITNPAQYRAIAFDLVRNAGAVVYVNGVEVARSNMPDGAIGPNTYAMTAPGASERKVPVRLEIPTTAFADGANTIAVELHLNWKSQPTAGFDLKVTGLPK